LWDGKSKGKLNARGAKVDNIQWIFKGTIKKTSPLDRVLQKHRTSEYKATFFDSSCYFKGYGYIDNTDLCIEMYCCDVGMFGYTYHRYDLSLVLDKGICCGIWLSSTLKNRTSGGSVILTREEKDRDELDNLIKENYRMRRDGPIIELK
jgi:hypothetical protein